jgi:hypothetical protein
MILVGILLKFIKEEKVGFWLFRTISRGPLGPIHMGIRIVLLVNVKKNVLAALHRVTF